MRNRMTRRKARKSRKNRKSRVQRGGFIEPIGFVHINTNTENCYSCGQRCIPADSELFEKQQECVNGEIREVTSVASRIRALKGATPPPSVGRLGGSLGLKSRS